MRYFTKNAPIYRQNHFSTIELIYCAAVDKIEEKRKPEDFIGHRKRGILSFRWRNDTLIGSLHLP